MKNTYYDSFIDSWTKQLEMHDLAVSVMEESDQHYHRVRKSMKNHRKRILWNITRAKNLKKAGRV
jgi:hypothetical protein